MLSGSLVDVAGNYVEGQVTVLGPDGQFVTTQAVTGGSFDIPVEDGTYKLEFDPASSEFASEYYRDKADLATADVVTVAGAAQTLPAWTIDRRPNVLGVVRTADGRPVPGAYVAVYDAATGTQVASDYANRDGSFRVGTQAASVKVRFSGYDPRTDDLLAAEWFNDKATLETADAVTPTAAGADLGVVSLGAGGSISGTVTTEAGAPIYRAYVCADLGYCDWTNASGQYLIEGVQTGTSEVSFTDPIGEYVGEYWDNVPLSSTTVDPTPVTVAPGQAVSGINAALAVKPATTPNGTDLSGTVRDEIGGAGVGYRVQVLTTPADPRDASVVAETYSNRVGAYHFDGLDRVGGETEFKVRVVGEAGREDGEFARRTIWAGDKLDYATSTTITAAPRTLDFLQPVAGGISGAVTSEAGGVPESPYASFRDVDGDLAGYGELEADGTYESRDVWAGDYTVSFGAYNHVTEWWKDATFDEATKVTVRPGQMATGISAALSKDVKALERPQVEGDAWVGKTLRVDKGRWNTEGGSKFTYEWLAGSTVVATGDSLKVTKAMLGKKLTARVTNDAGFAQGQAVTATTPKIGYKPKLKVKVTAKRIAMTLKAKPLKAKKVKASVVVYEVKGEKADGELKLKKIGKGVVKKGTGVATLKKALGKGKHQLVFRIKGKGKVGSGDLVEKVKIKR
ncbi:carboxypeptidase regulatory-like domain-containing protein [Nocardioides zeicaulis]|uniref:Carboxypeptidase regulatory-like domain-containing protein n=2 Tax=Nocardioides zeicaulis TaxID=1776857 RepID=A0ABV6E036_9ACTN